MFPNNMELFVEEQIAERYAEAEKYRLGQELAGQRMPAIKLKLAKAVYQLGCRMISWSERLQYPELTPVADETNA